MRATLIGGPFHGEAASVLGRECVKIALAEDGPSFHTYRWRMRCDRKFFGVHSSLSDDDAVKMTVSTAKDRAEFARLVRKTKKWVRRMNRERPWGWE